jgi:hypothetical protein
MQKLRQAKLNPHEHLLVFALTLLRTSVERPKSNRQQKEPIPLYTFERKS